MKKILSIIIFLSLILTSFECITYSKSNKCILKNTITYLKKGTRSESRHGHLFLNKKEIPDVYRVVICNDRAFMFFQRKHMWGRDGYFPVKIKEDDEIIKKYFNTNTNTIKKGYYKGNVRYKNTPKNWIFVKWDEGTAFVSPENIINLNNVLRLKAIPRVVRNVNYEKTPIKIDKLKTKDK